ncbi:MAG: hypothetical protein KKC75_04790 [Nanoarchaeota archaeon]|nr:hypothetical protein [Nanoarchaeota archaeon]MBU1005086.1 hypothetical protein [Nanoarchaeota archaeon]MBU1946428.1 hypothetical protein [Nanoarchaeota archaeon]
MKILIYDLNEFYSENVRLVKNLMKREAVDEYPELLKWKLQMLYFDKDKWIEICRIDNYPHEGQAGSHIHIYNKDKVKRVELSFEEAEKTIKEISSRILNEKFNENIDFGE